MAESIQRIRIVVASPSDVAAERQSLVHVVDELNQGLAADRGLHLQLVRWETDAYPGFHVDGPQGLIDGILKIEESDVLIGIFWKRFGTPVTNAESGTAHEFAKAYTAWRTSRKPHIMVYFNAAAYAPRSVEETTQWTKVLEFREQFPEQGLWWSYEGASEFERLARLHLTKFLRDSFQLPSASGVGTPMILHATAVIAPPVEEEDPQVRELRRFLDGYQAVLARFKVNWSTERDIQLNGGYTTDGGQDILIGLDRELVPLRGRPLVSTYPELAQALGRAHGTVREISRRQMFIGPDSWNSFWQDGDRTLAELDKIEALVQDLIGDESGD